MQLQFFNCPKPIAFQDAMSEVVQPSFLSYTPNWDKIDEIVKSHGHYKNLLIIGHGGSITSFYGFYHALEDQSTKKVEFINTVDPDFISNIKKNYDKSDSLVIGISKSGDTVTQLEAMLHFLDYPLLIISTKGSTLYQIGERLGATLLDHPPVGGRFTGFTEVALLPAALCGFEIKEMFSGALEYYQYFGSDNLAWRAASVISQLEQEQDYIGVFMPFYTHYLYPFSHVIVQLCHESFGKNGLGQSYYADEAPESQHHSNQRFFGGRQNLVGFFIDQEAFMHNSDSFVPPNLRNIPFKGKDLFLLNNTPLEKSLRFELEGTLADAKKKQIPIAYLSVYGRTPIELGRFLAFWQMYAVYGSLLRGVNAFDQPQVETSKDISFEEHLKFKGLI